MKTYYFTDKNGNIWRYYWDHNIRFWVAYIVNENGDQLSDEADYFSNKKLLLEYLKTKQ